MEPPVKTVSTVVVLAYITYLAMWLFRFSTGMWGAFLPNVSGYLGSLCPFVGSIAVALALGRFLWRNERLFVGDEPLCRACRYNLRGNVSGVCPECGTNVE